MLGVEGLVFPHQRIEPDRHRRAGLGNALPALGRLRRLDRLLRRLGGTPGQGHHVVVGRAPHRVAGGVGIIGRPLAPGALTQHASQAQEDEHCQRQKDDGVDIEHVSHALGSRDGTAGSVECRQMQNLRRQTSVPVPICKHATALIQGLAPNHRRRSSHAGP
jgi:hypothetical protein